VAAGCGFVVASGNSAVFVDQPVQYGFSADSLDIEVDCRDAGNLAVTVRNPLGHAPMRPGGVVVDLVLDQDGPQMRFTEDQHAVQELAAQGTEEAGARGSGDARTSLRRAADIILAGLAGALND
jgi:hypothetical protein